MFLVSKFGPKPFILSGIFLGSVGLLTASITNNRLIFSLACIIAGMSPGLSWSPFSDSVSRHVRISLQKRSLAIISTGASLGLGAIALLYILLDGSWQTTWIIGSIVGFLLMIWAKYYIPADHIIKNSHSVNHKLGLLKLINSNTISLFMACILFGITQATYWTYAADFVQQLFSFNNSNAIFYLITGTGGLAGLFAGDLIRLFGFKRSLSITILVYGFSIFVLFYSHSWIFICISGFLFGVTFMLYGAYLPIWSSEVFKHYPAKGFSSSILVMTVGTIIGPAFLGSTINFIGYKWIFLISSILALVKLFFIPKTIEN
ncbi:MFS transporter [Halobacillus salinarum]|uniref:MFS transporter n=2 Tax=Halobacillus salinarum TaxID=2932257 RepID=A0ABY4EJD3_9BACI|nr:MFS transporter [Halobacillus salinarum]